MYCLLIHEICVFPLGSTTMMQILKHAFPKSFTHRPNHQHFWSESAVNREGKSQVERWQVTVYFQMFQVHRLAGDGAPVVSSATDARKSGAIWDPPLVPTAATVTSSVTAVTEQHS